MARNRAVVRALPACPTTEGAHMNVSRNTEVQARYEEAIAKAHRYLHYAAIAAQNADRYGDREDLEQLLAELTRIGDAALRRPRRTRDRLASSGSSGVS